MEGDLKREAERNPHLAEYLRQLRKSTSIIPRFYETLSINELQEIRSEATRDPSKANFIYRVGTGYVHIDAPNNKYTSIEKALSSNEKKKYQKVKELILEKAATEPSPQSQEELVDLLYRLFDRCTVVLNSSSPLAHLTNFGKVALTPEEKESIRYFLRRDIAGYGPIEPLVLDPYIEDIHSVGTDPIHVTHKAFQYALETNIRFDDDEELNNYLISLSERIGRPVSAARPIIDGTLPDGSRINIIYSNDVSTRGSSFTIRKFTAEPISVIQLVKFGTFSAELAAYLWLCLEHKMNVMVAGETASGKTTTINAIIPFIDYRAKIYTAEDTPEIRPPHASWQRCVTRESGPEESRVTMFDLLRAALRSRPDYIIIGEIRGEEGRVAYQAMQTGIPVMATFHAATATKFIQRFTGDPIKVPITFIDNLNVLLLQSAVNLNGRVLRRVTAVEEFVGYSAEHGGLLTRNVFKWDPKTDKIQFRGMNNSYILEEKIAFQRGYADRKEIYRELMKRARIIELLLRNGILSYKDVNNVLKEYADKGEAGLPFVV
jgi:flagellar protein FlaI